MRRLGLFSCISLTGQENKNPSPQAQSRRPNYPEHLFRGAGTSQSHRQYTGNRSLSSGYSSVNHQRPDSILLRSAPALRREAGPRRAQITRGLDPESREPTRGPAHRPGLTPADACRGRWPAVPKRKRRQKLVTLRGQFRYNEDALKVQRRGKPESNEV